MQVPASNCKLNAYEIDINDIMEIHILDLDQTFQFYNTREWIGIHRDLSFCSKSNVEREVMQGFLIESETVMCLHPSPVFCSSSVTAEHIRNQPNDVSDL
jgi:hypothetical protein